MAGKEDEMGRTSGGGGEEKNKWIWDLVGEDGRKVSAWKA